MTGSVTFPANVRVWQDGGENPASYAILCNWSIFMKSKPENLKIDVTSKNASLERVLKKNEKIKKTVTQAASELSSINEALKQGKGVEVPVQIIKDVITQNKDVEYKVAKAADDLHKVNAELSREMAEREVLESELADTKTDLAGVRDDLSKSQTKEEETRKLSLQDALTGLSNRVLFEQSLDNALTQAKRHGWRLAVLFIDIDNFKNINDTYGHDVGDRVLIMVADRLKSSVREEDTVSRWAGDEFVCLLMEVRQKADVTRLAENMVNRISEAFEFNGSVLSVRVSIGIALYPADGETADILFKKADSSMYKAKRGQ
jgi:diguanylate cyclase (GGDEF)-like protein